MQARPRRRNGSEPVRERDGPRDGGEETGGPAPRTIPGIGRVSRPVPGLIGTAKSRAGDPPGVTDRWLQGWALGYAAVGGASLLVPLYALALGGGPALVGVLGATAAFAGVPGAVLWGRIAARTRRRRPFLLVALGLVTVVLAAVPAVGSPWLLVWMNAALQFVVAAAAPVLNLVMVDGRPESEWEGAIGRLNAVQGYGWVVGLVAGTAWTALAPRFGFGPLVAQRALFIVLAAGAAVGFLLVRFEYPEPPTLSEARFRRVYRRLGRAGDRGDTSVPSRTTPSVSTGDCARSGSNGSGPPSTRRSGATSSRPPVSRRGSPSSGARCPPT